MRVQQDVPATDLTASDPDEVGKLYLRVMDVRREDRWQLVAFQNTRVRPIGQNVSGTLLWLVSDWFWKWCLPRGA
jgi:hypothetical protein